MSRRPVEWAGLAFNDLGLPAVGARSKRIIVDADEAGAGNFSFEHYTKPTIVRIVGHLWFRLAAASQTVVENHRVNYMVGFMCSDEDLAAEDLETEPAHPWMWMDYGILHRPATGMPLYNGTTVVAEDKNDYGKPLNEHVFDIKTMRRVNRDCDLRMVIKTMVQVGSSSPTVSGFVRCLIKE